MAVGLAAFELAPGALLSLFDASENMLAIGTPALRIIALSFVLAGFCIISMSVCQAIGNPIYSLVVSVCPSAGGPAPGGVAAVPRRATLPWSGWPSPSPSSCP